MKHGVRCHFSIVISNMRLEKRDSGGVAHLTPEVPTESMELLEEILGTKLLQAFYMR